MFDYNVLDRQQAENIVKKLERLLNDSGFYFVLGAELEFYACHNFQLEAVNKSYNTSIHQERGIGQYELVVGHEVGSFNIIQKIHEAKSNLYKMANECDFLIDFSPKPFVNDYGSALHYHLNIIDDNRYNVFHIGNKDVSMMNVIASMLKHTNEALYLLTGGQKENFQRFVPGFMAPTHLSWGGNNRTTLVRVPDVAPIAKRIEFRLPSVITPPEYIVIFLLVSVLESMKQQYIHNAKIYGDASNIQYNLVPLLSDVVAAKKCFSFMEIIDNYTNLE